MLFLDEVILRPRNKIDLGRLVVVANLNGGPAFTGFTVHHKDGPAYYNLGEPKAIRGISTNLPNVLDLGVPVIRYDPRTVMLHDELRSGALYFHTGGAAVYMAGQRYTNSGKFACLDGTVVDEGDESMIMGVDAWEVGISRSGEFIKLATVNSVIPGL